MLRSAVLWAAIGLMIASGIQTDMFALMGSGGITRSTGTLNGTITYLDGPLQGVGVSNATIILFNWTMVEMARTSSDDGGRFSLEGITYGTNYTLTVSSPDHVEAGGTSSGYMNMTYPFDFEEDVEHNITISYYEYIAPTTGPVYGSITYKDGPNATHPDVGALILLISENGTEIGSTLANSTGQYSFAEVPFGTNYTIRIVPTEEMRGEQDVKTGYKEMVTSAFDLTDPTGMKVNVQLNHYIYIPTEKTHPRARIVDGKGEPIGEVLVTAVIQGSSYTAITSMDGWAVFLSLEGDTFPPGTDFKAEKEGFDTIEWEQGDPIPPLGKDPRDDTILVMVIIFLVVLVVLLLFFLAFKGGRAPISEE